MKRMKSGLVMKYRYSICDIIHTFWCFGARLTVCVSGGRTFKLKIERIGKKQVVETRESGAAFRQTLNYGKSATIWGYSPIKKSKLMRVQLYLKPWKPGQRANIRALCDLCNTHMQEMAGKALILDLEKRLFGCSRPLGGVNRCISD